MKAKSRSKSELLGGGARIVESVQELVDWVEGHPVSVRASSVDPSVVDVRAIRRKLRLTQSAFAAKIAVPTATVRSWEQGRAHPEGPARVLLAIIAEYPETVRGALRQAS